MSDANQFASLRLFVRSEEKLEEILTVLPDFPPALACRAYRLTLEGRSNEAVYWYMRAVEGYWNDDALRDADALGYGGACATAAQLVAGGPFRDESMLAAAAQIATKATQILPNSAKAHLSLGMSLLRLRRFDEAESRLKMAHEFDPANAIVQYYRAAVRLAQNGCNSSDLIRIQRELDLEITVIEQASTFLKAVNLC